MEQILFHDFKHHIASGLKWLDANQGKWDELIGLKLKSLGGSQFDYYIGELSVAQITGEIYSLLVKRELTDEKVYKDWLDSHGGYYEVALSDSSSWVLRYVNKKEFIHLHPSRYSKFTLRIKANLLKTVFCTLLFSDSSKGEFGISNINYFRVQFLGLSAINEDKDHQELKRVFDLFIKNKN